MIDQLRMMAIFQTVAEMGSFRQAAKKLKLSPSVVSHHVSQLEAGLGMPLLYRSTRRMSLTEAGVEMLAASQRMTAAAQQGIGAVKRRVAQPVGTLKVSLATAIASPPYSQAIIRFVQAYPKVHLSLHYSDHRTSLEGSQFDVALRGQTSDLDDSSYKARKVGRLKLCLFATPEYVAARPPVQKVDDLADWDRIASPTVPWHIAATTADGVAPVRAPRTVITCDNYTLTRQCVDAGLGFAGETYPLVAEDIRAGRLVEILPHIPLRQLEVHAVYPANAPRDGLAHLFIDFVAQQLWWV